MIFKIFRKSLAIKGKFWVVICLLVAIHTSAAALPDNGPSVSPQASTTTTLPDIDPAARKLLERMSNSYRELRTFQAHVSIQNKGSDTNESAYEADLAFAKPDKARLVVRNALGMTEAVTNGRTLWCCRASNRNQCLQFHARSGWGAIRQVLDVYVPDPHGATSNVLIGSAYFDGTTINMSPTSTILSVKSAGRGRIDGVDVDFVAIAISEKNPAATMRFAIGHNDGILRQVHIEARNGPSVLQDYWETYSRLTLNSILKPDRFVYHVQPGQKMLIGREAPQETALKTGQLAPIFDASDMQGNPIGLEHVRGQVVLLDFWASWCAPCVAEMPTIQAINQKYQKQGLVVIGISLDRRRQSMIDFVSSHDYTWPMVLDLPIRIATSYGVEAIPYTVLIGRDGKIAGLGLFDQDLNMSIDKALAKR